MLFLNIRPAFDGKTIKIFIDEVHLAENRPTFPTDLEKYSTNIDFYSGQLQSYSILLNIINSSKSSNHSTGVANQAETSTILFWDKSKLGKNLYQQTTLVFELPQIPHLALLLLAYVRCIFINIYCHIEFLDYSIESKLIKGEKEDFPCLPQSINEYFSHKCSGRGRGKCLIALMKKIVSLSSQSDDYKLTRQAIETLSTQYKENGNPFLENLSTALQDKGLFNSIGEKTLDDKIPLEIRTRNLLAFAKGRLRDEQKIELNYIINHINSMVKERIYNKCLGQKAQDGSLYNQSCMERDFLRAAEFTLLRDGRLSIEVSTYWEHYVPRKGNADLFQDKIIFFSKIIGLEFDVDTDFKKQIILTPNCSKELKNQGLHLNVTYMKKLLRQKCYFSLFRQAYEAYGEEHESNFSSALPIEIGEQIFDAISPELESKDRSESSNQVWTSRI